MSTDGANFGFTRGTIAGCEATFFVPVTDDGIAGVHIETDRRDGTTVEVHRDSTLRLGSLAISPPEAIRSSYEGLTDGQRNGTLNLTLKASARTIRVYMNPEQQTKPSWRDQTTLRVDGEQIQPTNRTRRGVAVDKPGFSAIEFILSQRAQPAP